MSSSAESKCACGDEQCSVFRRRKLHDLRAKQLEAELDNAYAERRAAQAEWAAHLDALSAPKAAA